MTYIGKKPENIISTKIDTTTGTFSGEVDAGSLDISGNADIDGTLEADAITINGTAIASVLSPIAGHSSIVTTGALNSGSITSGFGSIDTGSSTITTTGAITGGSLVADNITIDGTEIDLSSGDLTLDIASDLNIDVDDGRIFLKDGGTTFGRLANASTDFEIVSVVQDKDILFKGNDNGSEITALILDMSEGGRASFNDNINLTDTKKLVLGAGDDLQIYHDGSNSYVQDVGTGQLRIDTNGTDVRITKTDSEYMATFNVDGAVELYHNNSKKFETTSSGVDVTGGITADGEIDCASSSSLSTISASATGSCNLVMGTNFSGSASQGMPNQTGFINMRQSFPIIFGTAETERMRIASTGPLLINRTTGNSTASTAVDIDANQHIYCLVLLANGTNGAFVRLLANDGSTVGSIDHSGSTARYLTSSDYRLKENIVDMTDATTRLKELKPRRFNFITDDSNTTVDGFLAHEVSSIVPEAVNGEKDAMTEELLYVDGDEIPDGKKVGDVKEASKIDPQGIDQSKIVPLLVKTIQELEARITTLETA